MTDDLSFSILNDDFEQFMEHEAQGGLFAVVVDCSLGTTRVIAPFTSLVDAMTAGAKADKVLATADDEGLLNWAVRVAPLFTAEEAL